MARPAREETLRDLRQDVAKGRLKGTPELCDRLIAEYESNRASYLAAAAKGDAGAARAGREASVSLFMSGYCRYAKAQALALLGQVGPARAALDAARAYRARFPEFADPRLLAIWQELDTLSAGLIVEKSGRLNDALQAYLPATYGAGGGSAKATGRLALIEWELGHPDKARSWAFIHADDPTSQYVLAAMAAKDKRPAIAQRHLALAASLIQKQLGGNKEYMPVYFAEGPAIAALRRKLAPPPKPASP